MTLAAIELSIYEAGGPGATAMSQLTILCQPIRRDVTMA
jgi:hypothetical protein